jgi:hypothetical protein
MTTTSTQMRLAPNAATRDEVRFHIARLLSWIVAALIAFASAAGLWIDGLYSDGSAVAAMWRGYDLISLIVVAPLLAVMLLRIRQSLRARLVWLGLLGFVVYDYALYVFGARFNDLFLIHIALLSASIVAFVFALAGLDVDEIRRRMPVRPRVRWVGSVLMVLALSLGAMWVVGSLRFVVTGELPDEPSKLVVPTSLTHLGWALDLALLVPAYALAGIMLWRRSAWGIVLGTTLTVAGVVQQATYMTALVFQSNADVPGAAAFDPQEPFIAGAYVVAAGALLLATPKENARRPA